MRLRTPLKDLNLNLDDPNTAKEFRRLMSRALEAPEDVVAELMATRRGRDEAAGAAESIESLIDNLVGQNATLCHLETLRPQPDGTVRAVCRAGSQLQELGVHPDVDRKVLERIQAWEYLLVHDGVVIGTWHDNPMLHAAQMGDVVTFDGFTDREQSQVRVTRPGHDEAIVTLADTLTLEDLRPGMRLVLQRDDPRWAIAALPAENAESQFEVSIDSLRTRLQDLAGIDEVAEPFLQDILLRMVCDEIRDEFQLRPMNGALLYSYQPGMGKTVFCEALAVTLRDLGRERGFDVALFHVKPNQLKNMYWGEDGRIVRDLFAAIRARAALPRTQPLIVLVVFDEIDSLQKRAGGNQFVGSSSHSDALEALLVEMQGLGAVSAADGPSVQRLCIGLTNRPDRLDDALKRPGRFGDTILAMPAISRDSAAEIMAVHARGESIPWSIEGEIRRGVPLDEVRERFLRPAVARMFPAVVARYATDTQRTTDVTAGEILAGAHYADAVNRAKKQAALRRLMGDGIPAICPEDIADNLLTVAVTTAEQMEGDPAMLVQQLQVKVPVVRVTVVPEVELVQHRFLKPPTD